MIAIKRTVMDIVRNVILNIQKCISYMIVIHITTYTIKIYSSYVFTDERRIFYYVSYYIQAHSMLIIACRIQAFQVFREKIIFA